MGVAESKSAPSAPGSKRRLENGGPPAKRRRRASFLENPTEPNFPGISVDPMELNPSYQNENARILVHPSELNAPDQNRGYYASIQPGLHSRREQEEAEADEWSEGSFPSDFPPYPSEEDLRHLRKLYFRGPTRCWCVAAPEIRRRLPQPVDMREYFPDVEDEYGWGE
jgi:hypothetical protein